MSLYNATSLKDTRKSLSLTQKELASKLGISVKTLQRYEKGTSEIPTEISSQVHMLENQLVITELTNFETSMKASAELSKYMIAQAEKTRHAQHFEPSVNGDIDKIRMSEILKSDSKEIFKTYMNGVLSVDPVVKYWKGNGTKSSCSNWEIHCDDCRIYVGYGKYVQGKVLDVLTLEFNPNKWNEESNEYLPILLGLLGINPTIHYVDVCKDIEGVRPSQIIEISNPKELVRKTYEDKEQGLTYYIGNKSDKENNNLMVYDKRHEILKKDGKDIDINVTRLETRIFYKPGKPLFDMQDLQYKVNMPILEYFNNHQLINLEGTMSIWTAHALQILKGHCKLDLLDQASRDILKPILESMDIKQVMISQADIARTIELFKIRYVNYYLNKCTMSEKQQRIFEEIYMRPGNREKYDDILGAYEQHQLVSVF